MCIGVVNKLEGYGRGLWEVRRQVMRGVEAMRWTVALTQWRRGQEERLGRDFYKRSRGVWLQEVAKSLPIMTPGWAAHNVSVLSMRSVCFQSYFFLDKECTKARVEQPVHRSSTNSKPLTPNPCGVKGC